MESIIRHRPTPDPEHPERRILRLAFTGYRPQKMPFGFNEQDARCIDFKNRLRNTIESFIWQGYRHFIYAGADAFLSYLRGDARKTICKTSEIPEPGSFCWTLNVRAFGGKTIVEFRFMINVIKLRGFQSFGSEIHTGLMRLFLYFVKNHFVKNPYIHKKLEKKWYNQSCCLMTTTSINSIGISCQGWKG